jgi:S-formylglutathione hydrolase FrmB
VLRKLLFVLIFTTTSFAASRVECGRVPSKYVGSDVSYCALLPPSFATNTTKTFPILYLLHGLGDNEQTLINSGIWNMVEELQTQKQIGDFVIVTPAGGRSFYINAKAAGQGSQNSKAVLGGSANAAKQRASNYEDFFVKEFMPNIERKYHAGGSRSRRAIAGISMGGFGALRTAFKYPQMFSAVAAHSAALIEKMPRGAENTPVGMILGSVFGSPFDPSYWESQSPFAYAKTANLSGLKIYFDCGDQDSYGFDTGARALDALLTKRRVAHEFHIYPGGHDWPYFAAHLPASLQFVSKALAPKSSVASSQ